MSISNVAPDSEKTIAILKGVLKDPYCSSHLTTSSVVGFLGEIYVKQFLQSPQYTVQHLGKQHNLDLEVPALGAKLDVKTSRLKNEIGCNHWGWALLSKTKKKELAFTHLVCVGLDEQFEPAQVMVIAREHLDCFPGGNQRFGNNERTLVVIAPGQDLPKDAKDTLKKEVKLCESLEKTGKIQRVACGDSLARILDPSRRT